MIGIEYEFSDKYESYNEYYGSIIIHVSNSTHDETPSDFSYHRSPLSLLANCRSFGIMVTLLA